MPSPSLQPVMHRFDRIDLLRGLSVLLVVLAHASYLATRSGHPPALPLPALLQDLLFKTSGYAVQCFFTVSGFLITLTSVRRFGSLRHMRPLTFYKFRFARIAPLLLLLLCVLSILQAANLKDFHIDPGVSNLPRALFAVLTFHFNWLESARGWFPPSWGVLWTLSVEEAFYVFFPLLCWLLLRKTWGRALFLSLLGALIVAGPYARTPAYTSNPIWHLQSYLGATDNIALGCLFARLAARLTELPDSARSALPRYLLPAGAAFMLLGFLPFIPGAGWLYLIQRPMWNTCTDMTVLGLGTCLVMLGSVLRPAHNSRFTAPVRWFGRNSYEVYLTHQFVVLAMVALLTRADRPATALWFFATVALAGLLGSLIARFFSEPMNRLLRKGC